jgi:hypothetical protein
MQGSRIKTLVRMAAPAAILVLLPGMAMAEVCDKGGDGPFLLSDYVPVLKQLIESSPHKAQLEQAFTPASLVTAALLVWLLASNSVRPAIVALCWFGLTALLFTYGYFSIDMNDPFYKAAVSEGCMDPSPRRAYMAWLFTAMAIWLTWQRMRRQKTG